MIPSHRIWTSADDRAVLVDARNDPAERLLDPDRPAGLLRETGFRFRNLAAFGGMRLRKGHRAYLAQELAR